MVIYTHLLQNSADRPDIEPLSNYPDYYYGSDQSHRHFFKEHPDEDCHAPVVLGPGIQEDIIMLRRWYRKSFHEISLILSYAMLIEPPENPRQPIIDPPKSAMKLKEKIKAGRNELMYDCRALGALWLFMIDNPRQLDSEPRKLLTASLLFDAQHYWASSGPEVVMSRKSKLDPK